MIKKVIFKHSLIATMAVFSVAMAVPAVTFALPARAEEAQTNATENREAAQTRLDNVKLKVCQSREKTVNNILARIADRGQKQVDLFTKIADRTEAFYTEKGKTLSNYDALVADVTAKKAAAQTAVDATKATSVTFACDGTDPKGVVSTFQQQMKTQNEALKAYKTAVKNLIVGVKSVQGTTSSDKSSTGGNQ